MIDVERVKRALARDLCLSDGCTAFPTHLTSVEKEEQVAEFRARYQLYNFSRKLETDSVPEWQRSDSFEMFQKLQQRGKAFNDAFKPTLAMERAKWIIHSILPPVAFIEDDMWPLCNFGPGTFNGASSHEEYSLHYKIGHDQTVTGECKGLAIQVLRDHFPNWASKLIRWKRKVTTVDGNRLSHVPKDVGKCRPIAIEPSLNLFLQQGIGEWLKRHLRATGFVDLVNGQALNRVRAQDLRNGTIDLSSASDTIYLSLVKFLLPSDWFELLDATRSKRWAYRDKEGTYENLSSQGNAFTFPVESLIFKALVMGATELTAKEVTTYGDDIIVPTQYAECAVAVLEDSGFVINHEKSYWGQHDDIRKYFRESCGADYLFGELVTPVYVRKQPKKLSDVAVLFNRMVEEWPSCRRAISSILVQIPEELHGKMLFGPRFFVSDRPGEFVNMRGVVVPLGMNTVVSTYDQWFWTEGPFEGRESSKRMWFNKPRGIPKTSLLNNEVGDLTNVSELTFIYGGTDTLPRLSNPRAKKVDVTPWAGAEQLRQVLELKGGRVAPWRRFGVFGQIE